MNVFSRDRPSPPALPAALPPPPPAAAPAAAAAAPPPTAALAPAPPAPAGAPAAEGAPAAPAIAAALVSHSRTVQSALPAAAAVHGDKVASECLCWDTAVLEANLLQPPLLQPHYMLCILQTAVHKHTTSSSAAKFCVRLNFFYPKNELFYHNLSTDLRPVCNRPLHCKPATTRHRCAATPWLAAWRLPGPTPPCRHQHLQCTGWPHLGRKPLR